jgi:quercetin dioxygenase-like cupin family protein
MPGVTRMMLDRIGDEVARATSLVRYAPNSVFSPHTHGGGEEILVLKGEFADEHGRYPAGSYLRNPVGTAHAPRVGEQGAEIFVKLHQFDARDQRQCALDTTVAAWLPGRVPGYQVMPLHRFGPERVRLLRWPANTTLETRRFPGGAELLLLEGGIETNYGALAPEAWLRLPTGAELDVSTGSAPVLAWLKSGHLSEFATLVPGQGTQADE